MRTIAGIAVRGMGLRGIVAGVLTLAFWLTAGSGARAEVSEVDGQYRADYQSIESSLLTSNRLQQQLDIGTMDRLWGTNTLRMSLTSQRYTDVDLGRSDTANRVRMQLTGNAYSLVGLYSPRSGSGFSVEGQGDQSEDLQLTWQYQTARMPAVRATFRRNRHYTNGGDLLDSESEERSVQIDHKVGFVEMTGSWRNIEHDNAASEQARSQDHLTARMTARRELARGVAADFALDYQNGDTSTGDDLVSEGWTRNVRAGLAWTRRRDLQALINVQDRKNVARSGGVENEGLNREISSRLTWTPTPEVKMDLRRDVRDVKQGSVDTYSDVMRYQAGWNGRVRNRLRGRLNVIKNFALSTRDISAPADNVDLTLDAGLFRRTTLRATVQVSRRPSDTSSLIGRYGVQRYFDLRTKLTRRIEGNVVWRSNLNADSISFSDATNRGLSAGLVFTGSRGLTASASYRRTEDTRLGRRVGNSLTGNIHLTVSESWSWSASGTVSDMTEEIDDQQESGQGDSFFVRSNYNIGPQTSFHVSWSESTPSGGIATSGFSASFTTAF